MNDKSGNRNNNPVHKALLVTRDMKYAAGDQVMDTTPRVGRMWKRKRWWRWERRVVLKVRPHCVLVAETVDDLRNGCGRYMWIDDWYEWASKATLVEEEVQSDAK